MSRARECSAPPPTMRARGRARELAAAAVLCSWIAVQAGFAATLKVTTYGVDGPSCGDTSTPCRTIGGAIAVAEEGDKISVGPGLYGDVNRNGVLGDMQGEESPPPGCSCTIAIDKTVAVESTSGAGATTIHGVGNVVRITARGVGFGKKAKGFSLTGGGQRSVYVPPFSGAAHVRIEGNIALGRGAQVNCFEVAEADVIVRDNIAQGCVSGVVTDGDRVLVLNNTALSNRFGFQLRGFGNVVTGNVASGNTDAGFVLRGAGHALRGNTATGHPEPGYRVIEGGGHALASNVSSGNAFGLWVHGGASMTAVGNAFVGNTVGGVVIESAANATVTKGNIFGNGVYGFFNGSAAIVAVGNFWGRPEGPLMLDIVNSGLHSSTTFAPFATKELRIKVKGRP